MFFFFFSISCFSREVRMYSTLRMCAVRIGTSTPMVFAANRTSRC